MVTLEPWSARWAEAYATEAARLRIALLGPVDAVEHIGSTAVPGLLAKPVVDIAVRTVPGADPFALADPLTPLGYRQHTAGPKTHGVYVREQDGVRTHIVHAFTTAEWATCAQRLLRDRLLRDPDARAAYTDVKRAAAAHEDGRDYTAAKTAIVQRLLDEERAARGLPAERAWQK